MLTVSQHVCVPKKTPVVKKLHLNKCSPKATIKSNDITEKFPTGAAKRLTTQCSIKEKNRNKQINSN